MNNRKLLIIIFISAISITLLILAYRLNGDKTRGSSDLPLDTIVKENNDDKVNDPNLEQDNGNLNSDNNKDESNELSHSDDEDSKNDNNNFKNEDKDTVDNLENVQAKEETNTDVAAGNMDINDEGIYAVSNNYFELLKLDEKSILRAANYLNNLQETYLSKDNKVFYAVIPDKTYYDNKSSYEKFDYDKMVSVLNENVKNMKYIPIKDLLNLDDYYKTDIHWKQQNIIDVANRIGENLGFSIEANEFEVKYMKFKGMYSKYITDSENEEELQYLTNNYINNALVDNFQNKDFKNVYDTELSSADAYNVFLSGSTPFLTITNSLAKNDKELIIFRDSFASSLAPLLISEYSKITLIDTRFMASVLLKDFVSFDSQDILFLYSSALINNSNMLK